MLERRKTRTFLYLLFDLSLTKTRFLFGFDFLLPGWVIFTQSFTLRTRGSDERKSIFSTRRKGLLGCRLFSILSYFFFLNFHVYEFSKYLKSICKNNCDSTLKFARKITGICLEIVICRHRCINFSGLSKPHLTSVQPREILGELPLKLVFPSHNTISSRNIKDISYTEGGASWYPRGSFDCRTKNNTFHR